jgi:rRNA maturation protein Rpf1
LKKQYTPEANILIQNTQNIQELYIDDREHAKHEDSNKGAFQTLVNAKFKDLTQKTEYQTVEFSTQGYYKEAMRLSKDPALYINEKVNPIFKYVPVKSGYGNL